MTKKRKKSWEIYSDREEIFRGKFGNIFEKYFAHRKFFLAHRKFGAHAYWKNKGNIGCKDKKRSYLDHNETTEKQRQRQKRFCKENKALATITCTDNFFNVISLTTNVQCYCPRYNSNDVVATWQPSIACRDEDNNKTRKCIEKNIGPKTEGKTSRATPIVCACWNETHAIKSIFKQLLTCKTIRLL